MELYDASMNAYYHYVATMNGDTLVRGQRVSPAQVERARRMWLLKERKLRLFADLAKIRELLQARSTGKEVKRHV